MTIEQLNNLKNTPILTEERVDISSVHIDQKAPQLMRVKQFFTQIKNPYAYKCGDIAVNIRFSEGDNVRDIDNAISTYLMTLKNSI